MKYKFLKILLLLGAIGWGSSIIFVVSSWEFYNNILAAIGASPVPYKPMFDYWLKMASIVFVCFGILFLLAFLNIEKYKAIIPVLGLFSIIIGSVLLFAAISNNLNLNQHLAFVVDVFFCYFVGCGIIYSFAKNKL